MYDKKTNTITFPHVIPSPVLDGKKFTLNDAKGGARKLADMEIDVNSFYGGNCHSVFMITEYGFYLCPQRETNTILGFYVHDWKLVTDLGKEVLQRRFPDCKIVYGDTVQNTGLTQEEITERNRQREEAIKYGIDPNLITHTTSEELAGLIKAVKSGESEKKIGYIAPSVSQYATESIDVEEKIPYRSRSRNKV